MKVIVGTKDRRTFNGYNTRSKIFDTVDTKDPSIIKWVKGIKNRMTNSYTVIDGCYVQNIMLK